MNILAELRKRFETALTPSTDQPAQFAEMVRPAQDSRFGDYQANFAMPLAKQQGRNPRELAAEIVARLDVSDICNPPEIAGPGFINLRLRDDWLQARTNELVGDERLGVPAVAQPRTYVIDYSAPNVAKPMHVGHLRSTVIGAALEKIHRFLGHRVISDNHIGDWGTQFGMIIFGYKHFLDAAAFERDPVGELARLYRLVNQLSDYHESRALLPKLDAALAEKLGQLESLQPPADEKDKVFQKARKKLLTEVETTREQIAGARRKLGAVDDNPQLRAQAAAFPDIAVQARLETAKLHAGDPENRQLWEHFVPLCLAALQGIYDRLDIRFDVVLGESFYQPLLAGVVEDLLQRGLARESEGAICVFIPGVEAPFIVRKSDGAFTYATTDLATIKYRVEQLGADAALYVVDARQSDHFKLLFETARLWGYDQIELKHVSFGTILGDDGRPFKTRSGDTVGLESLLDEAIVEARKVITQTDEAGEPRPVLDPQAQERVAEVVGLGGIKYADLKHNRESDYVFSWEKMLAKSGDTATYMQYAYARVCGIVRKGGIDRASLRGLPDAIRITAPAERTLAFQVNRLAEALSGTAGECRPNILTDYLFQTANAFSTFYEECPVQKAETDELRISRLLLCDITARVIEHGLGLLGIQTIEQM
jgi:arginyl-tRNA synthetase